VDECGTHIALTPVYGRAPRGERLHGAVPHRRGTNLTLLAALGPAGLGAAMTLDGAADTPAFVAYVRELLVPTLRPGQIVFLDNLSAHKDDAVRTLIEGAGCALRFLPPYSPDLTPIEQAFSKLKALLRRAGARTREALEPAIREALEAVSAADARAWFARCGYQLPAPATPEQSL
jgi:transposase